MGVLRLREFRLLFGAQAVSIIGDRMVGIALAFAVLELGGSATEVGMSSPSGSRRWWPRFWSGVSSPIASRGGP